jgi:hypothetical protein
MRFCSGAGMISFGTFLPNYKNQNKQPVLFRKISIGRNALKRCPKKKYLVRI